MRRGTLWTWLGVAIIGVGLAGTAGADPWDRDHEGSGRERMHAFRDHVAARDQVARPSLERSVTGHELGRETIQRDAWKRDFRDRNDMMSHMNTQTTMRAARTSGARGDGENSGDAGDRAFPNAGRGMSNPTEVMAKHPHEDVGQRPTAERGGAPTPIMAKSVTGRELGKDTITKGDVSRNFKDRNDMMSQLNTSTKIRGSATAAATSDEGVTNQTFPNAGRHVSDPSHLTDEARKGLAAAGFSHAAKQRASSDIEDKAR